MSRRALLALVLVAAAAWPAIGERLTIVYTNDLHLRPDRLASIERVVADARASGAPVLLVDAGDAWHDFRVPLYAVWGAERMIEWMNRVGYNAMAPGNHDVYWGWPRLDGLLAETAFPVVCANFVAVDGSSSPFVPSVHIAVGGLDVLVVGIGPFEHWPAFDLPWLRPTDPATALRREIDASPGDPDLVVCLGHIRIREAKALALAVPDVDVFVTAHSHAATPTPVVVGKSLLVQSGAFGRYVGQLTLDVNEGAITLVEHKLVPTNQEAAANTGRGLSDLAKLVLAIVLFSVVLAF